MTLRRRSWLRAGLIRVLLVAVGTLLVLAAGMPVAGADGSATLSNLQRSADGVVSGVLTVPASDASVVVDSGSLRLFVAGRQYAVKTAPASTVERSVVLLIDRSGSMKANGGMEALRAAVNQFLSVVPADVKVGVTSFADQVTLDVAPTTDRNAVRAVVAKLQADGDTRLNDGIAQAVQQLGSTGERSILLLSDGENNQPGPSDQELVDRIRTAGIRVQAVAFRTGSSANLSLGLFAAAGQGSVVAVGDGANLSTQFAAVARTLDGQVTWQVPVGADLHGAQTVTLRGNANGKAFSAVSSVDFPAAPAPAPTTAAPSATVAPSPPPVAAPEVVPARFLGVALPVAIGAVVLFVGIALLVLALLSPAFRSRRRERVDAVDQYVGSPGPARGGAVTTSRHLPVSSLGTLTEQLAQIGDRVVEGREWTSRTMLLLQRADLPWRPGEWAVLRVVCLILGVIGGALLLHDDWYLLLGLALGTIAGLVLPPILLRFLAARRARHFEAQLPDVLMLVASSLSTGFSLPQALDAVARDMAEPAAKEFSRALAETRIGAELEQSLMRMSDRMGSENMTLATMAIEIQRRVGGNLAETMRTTATTLREREALYRHVRALSAEGRLSGWILVLLPIGVALWMIRVNGDYIGLLFHSPLGILMALGAVFLMGIGIFWMRRVVEVEV